MRIKWVNSYKIHHLEQPEEQITGASNVMVVLVLR